MNKYKELTKVGNSGQDSKIEFNEERDLLKKN